MTAMFDGMRAAGAALSLSAALGCSLMLATAASAQQQRMIVSPRTEPMKFAIVEGDGPRGAPRWISAAGQIRTDTAREFERFTRENRIDGLPVVLDSPGGSVNSGMAIGRALRKAKATVHVGRTLERGGTPAMPRHAVDDRESQCNSACVLILMGGEKREVSRRAHVGVHLFSASLRPDGTRLREQPTTEDIEDAQRTMVRHAIYVQEMGVDLGVLELMAAAPFRSLRRIQPPELERLKLATLIDDFTRPAEASALAGSAGVATASRWSFRRSAEAPQLTRKLTLFAEEKLRADHGLVLGCSNYRDFLMVTYQQSLQAPPTGGEMLAVNSLRLSGGAQDHVMIPRLPLIARRQGDDLWLRRETPMALIEAALAAKSFVAEPRRFGVTLPKSDFFDADFQRLAPELLRACRARRDQSSIGLHPRH
jgi:hypothetical protein